MGKSTVRKAWYRDRETGERWVGEIRQHSRPQTPTPSPPPTRPLQEEEKTSTKTPTNPVASPAPTRTPSPIYELSAHDAVPKLAPPDPNSRITNLDWNELSKCQSDKHPDAAQHHLPQKARQTPKVQSPSDARSSDTHNSKPRAQVHWTDQDGLIPVGPNTGDGGSQNGQRPSGRSGDPGQHRSRPTHDYQKGGNHRSGRDTSNSQRESHSDNHEGRQSRQRHHNAQQSKGPEDSRGRGNERSGGSRTNVDSHDDRPGRRGTRGHGDGRSERGHPHHDRQSSNNIRGGAADLHSQSNRPAPRSSSNYRSPYAESVTDSSCE